VRTERVLRCWTTNCFIWIPIFAGAVAFASDTENQDREVGAFLTFGVTLAGIEEGGRVFGPIQFLPLEHPASAGHDFPNPPRFHQAEVDILVHLGEKIGLGLQATLTRYPDPPTDQWPYPVFAPPPLEAVRVADVKRVSTGSTIPGLRVVAIQDGFPLAFIVDTRDISLKERGMARATAMGLDMTRQEFLDGLRESCRAVPPEGTWILVYPSGARQGPLSERVRAELMQVWNDDYRTPQDYVVDKFRDNNWVFLGEYHRIRHDVELVSSLIPRLHETTDVRHLALEFLCQDHTGAANRLITAPEYEPARTIEFFRKQFAGWPYREYLKIFEEAWASNQNSGTKRGVFRLVGLHPCIDWELIHYGADEDARQQERKRQLRYDEIMAEVLEASVLEPGLKTLVFTGIAHATAKYTEYVFGTDEPLMRMGNLVYKEPYRSDMFFIALHAPFWDSSQETDIYPFDGAIDRLMRGFGRDVGFDVVGTPFESLLHERTGRYSITWHRFGELYDGYIAFRTPIKEFVGVTCIENWIEDEADFRQYWRNLSNEKASQAFSRMPFEQFKKEFCRPRPDHGVEFRRRFRNLPNLD